MCEPDFEFLYRDPNVICFEGASAETLRCFALTWLGEDAGSAERAWDSCSSRSRLPSFIRARWIEFTIAVDGRTSPKLDMSELPILGTT